MYIVPRSTHSLAFDKIEQVDEPGGVGWREEETKAEVKQENYCMLSSFLAQFYVDIANRDAL